MINDNNVPKKNFVPLPNDLVRDPRLTPKEKCLLIYLWSHTDKFNPTYSDIENATGMAPQTIKSCLGALVSLKSIEVTPGGRTKPNKYRILKYSEWDLSSRSQRQEKGTKTKERADLRRSEMFRQLGWQQGRAELLAELAQQAEADKEHEAALQETYRETCAIQWG